MPAYPKLRHLDIRPIHHRGRPALLVRDPLELSGRYLILPQALGPALLLCDGQRDVEGIEAALMVQWGVRLGRGVIDELLAALDEALFLDNARSAEAMARARQAYREAPFRSPAIAGNGYPAEAEELRTYFDELLAGVEDGAAPAHGRGLISPHIDYSRGGEVYARVWKEAEEMARAAELVIVFGTDHYAGYNPITLTLQHYATPYGVLPTQIDIVQALAKTIGPEKAFAGELFHRQEHSIELVLTWLHHMRGGQPVEIVPILTGSFMPFIENGREPSADPLLRDLLATLRQEAAGYNTLVLASGDLAHIGPAFGGEPVGIIERAELRAHDDAILKHLAAGDEEGFWGYIKSVQDSKNVCGVSPFYLALKWLGQVEGRVAGYDVCPADEQNTSVVSICGMVFG
ncbi:MAG: AmmeMemoRadiSam system protein B [Chloroflexi bacterium]|nr:AmmeMemoRadiSam system protein B [Chloroflexota bacterium]